MTLKSIEVVVPKVKSFNGEFSDIQMCHFDDGRKFDRPPGPIPSGLVKEKVFVFWETDNPHDIDKGLDLKHYRDRLIAVARPELIGGINAMLSD